jgi:hypothetical protein
MSQRAIAYVQTIAPLLTESEALVALAIAELASEETDVAEATLAQIGALADRKERCVRYCLRAIERHGLLVRDYQPSGHVIAKTFYWFAQLVPLAPPERRSDQSVRHIADAARRRAELMRLRNAAIRSRMLAWRQQAHGCAVPTPSAGRETGG